MTRFPTKLALAGSLAAVGFASLATAGRGAEPSAPAAGLQREVAFAAYPAFAGRSELARRLLGPKAYRAQQAALGGEAQPVVDLGAERFALYVPRRKPPGGYALVVFIAPWREAALPPGWGLVLDDHGAIFVSAARSGNEESVHLRRIPLALIAAANVAAKYDVDRSRIYIAGFSGGSRAAERVALEYPDIFSGAILNAGADPIGEALTPIPHAELMERFQTASRLVLVTGARDEASVGMDATARSSLRAWCVAHVGQITMPRTGHEVATPEALDEALKAVGGGSDDARATARSQRCRAELSARLAADAARVRAMRASGEAPAAVAAESERLERAYGWLAADALADPAPGPAGGQASGAPVFSKPIPEKPIQ